MDLQHQFESAHKEHEEILEFLEIWEGVLKLLGSEDSKVRLQGLRQLQKMEPQIAEICEHCRREEEVQDSPLFLFAERADRGRM